MACRQRRRDFDRFEKRRSSGLSTGTRRPGEGGVLPPSLGRSSRSVRGENFFFEISRRGRLRRIAGAGACTRQQAAVSCRRLRRAGSLLRNPVPEKRQSPECDSHSEELPPPFRVGPCCHSRRRNVRRNVRAKFPWRDGNGVTISTDLRNVGPRGYRPARVARARAGSCRRASAGRRGRFEEKIFFFEISRRGRLRPIAGAGACTRPQAAVSCRRLRRAGSLLRNPVPEKRQSPECDSHSEELSPPFRVGPCCHSRRRNVRRNVRAKFPARGGIGDAILTDLRNVGPRGYRPARVARARAGSCRRASAGRRGRFEEKKFFFHNRRRNVRRNVRAKFPWRAGNGDAISTDLRNVGPRGYRLARVARARAGSCRRASAGRRGRFEEKIFFFHNRRRNVGRNSRAKFPPRAGIGDVLSTDRKI